ncbi:MAG TPA: hypothetical protein VIK75_11135 [Calditerricola sp.]
MAKFHRLDELPLASLSDDQLRILREAEEKINAQTNRQIYLMALERPTS